MVIHLTFNQTVGPIATKAENTAVRIPRNPRLLRGIGRPQGCRPESSLESEAAPPCTSIIRVIERCATPGSRVAALVRGTS